MITYQLKNNGGNNNNDCLLIAIGRFDNPNLKEEDAVKQGWQAVFNGVSTMEVDALQMLHTELKNVYKPDMSNINNYFSLDFNDDKTIKSFETELKETFGDNNLSPEIVQAQLNDRVKQEVNDFLSHLKQQENLQKYIELLKAIPENKKQNLMLVSNNDLESHLGQVYEEFRDLIVAGKVPHFLVHNGAHYSNVVPTVISQENITSEDQIKKAFVDLMNNALATAAGFIHPAVWAKLQNGQSASYTLDMLNNDLQFEQDMRQAKTESNQLTVPQSSVVKNPNANINWDVIEQQVNQTLTDSKNNQKLTQLLEFIDNHIDPAYQNNSNYTYSLSHTGKTYNVPWSLMQAYDSRTFGSYDHAKILAGLKADLAQENSADIISKKLKDPMYGMLYNNTYGVSKEYLECLKNPDQFNNEVIMTVNEKKEAYQSHFLHELNEILSDKQKMIGAMVALEVLRSKDNQKLDNQVVEEGLKSLNTANVFDYQTIADNYKLGSSISAEALNQYGVKSDNWSEAQRLFIGTAITCAAERTLQRFLPQDHEISSDSDKEKLTYLKQNGGLYQDLTEKSGYQAIIKSAKDTWSVEKNDNEFSLFNPENQKLEKQPSKS